MRLSTKIRRRASEQLEHRILDTSTIVDIVDIDVGALPKNGSIAAITLAELTAGIVSTADRNVRAMRLSILQTAENLFAIIPFDVNAARAYGRIYAAAMQSGQKPRGRRAVDFMIAATALSRRLPIYTRNADDFSSLDGIVQIISV